MSLALLAVFALGCARTAPQAPEPNSEKPPDLHLGPLTTYVPSAGLRWMVVADLRRLAETPGLLAAFEPLLPDAGLDRYAEATEVDLRKVDAALVAGFDFAVLYAALTGTASEAATQAFVERLVSGAVTKQPHPHLTRVSGIVGVTPQTLVRVDDHLVAVAVGDPTPARVVEAFARRKLRRSPHALAGGALSTLPDDLSSAPLRFYAPGPFKDEWLMGARGLLAQTVAIGVGVDFPDPRSVRARLILSGDFGDGATQRLLGAWEDLARSSLGKLLGFDQPLEAPVISTGPARLELTVLLALQPIVSGLRAAVVADVWEILDVSKPDK